MGTQITQIMNHYSHRQTRDESVRQNITQMKRKKKVAQANDFVGEALQRYKDGKLSESALREILGANE